MYNMIFAVSVIIGLLSLSIGILIYRMGGGHVEIVRFISIEALPFLVCSPSMCRGSCSHVGQPTKSSE